MKDYYDNGKTFLSIIECPFKNKCINADTFKCHSCKNNKGKRDYYEPEPYRPYKPSPYPFFPRPTWVMTFKSQTRNLKTPYFSE